MVLRILAAAVYAFAAAGTAQAQDWPARPVRFIVPGSASSAPDLVVRALMDKLTAAWGRQVVVEAKPGGNTIIGAEAAAKSAPDGYTFLFTQAAALTITPYTTKSLPYDVEKDFTPIVYIGYSPMMIAVHPDVPARDLRELIALAKSQPGKMTYATSSTKNVPHLTGELFKRTAGLDILHVPYKGSAQAVQDAMGGQAQIVIDGASPLLGPVRSARLRAIAVTSAQRFPSVPDIPAVAEVLPGFDVRGWFAIVAPTGAPAAVVTRVNRDVNTTLAMPDVIGRLRDLGVIPVGGTPEELAKTLRTERETYARIIKEAGIQPD